MKRARWEPGWYYGDQSIAVRLTEDYLFREIPKLARGRRPLVFYDGGSHGGEVVVAHGTISRIWHPQLGEIREIDTGGDNYRVYLANGTVFDVDQEQNPGWIGDAWAFDADGKAQPRRAPGVQRWRLDVEFESLSDLRPVDLGSWQAGRRRGERRMTIDELSQRHGVAVASLVDAALALGLSGTTAEPLSAEDVYAIEAQLGLDRP
jgi:hypothetical protein